MRALTVPPTRDEALAAIRAGVRERADRRWSVVGGRGTSWSWLTITAPPSRLVGGAMSEDDRAALAALLGLQPGDVHPQGVMVDPDRYREWIARAAGRTP